MLRNRYIYICSDMKRFGKRSAKCTERCLYIEAAYTDLEGLLQLLTWERGEEEVYIYPAYFTLNSFSLQRAMYYLLLKQTNKQKKKRLTSTNFSTQWQEERGLREEPWKPGDRPVKSARGCHKRRTFVLSDSQTSLASRAFCSLCHPRPSSPVRSSFQGIRRLFQPRSRVSKCLLICIFQCVEEDS